MSEHVVQLIRRIAQPMSLTLHFKKPSKFDSYQLKPFVGAVDVQAIDCVCDGGHTFIGIRDYCKSLLASSSAESLPFWSEASRIAQQIEEFAAEFEELKFVENKRPGVLPVIKLADRSQIDTAF